MLMLTNFVHVYSENVKIHKCFANHCKNVKISLKMISEFFLNLQVRENAAKLTFDDKGNMLYSVDIAGYRPEELQVNIEGDQVIIQAEHKSQTDSEFANISQF